MPGGSRYIEDLIVKWLLKQTAFPSAPTQLWFSLHSDEPGRTGANEFATVNGYARAQLNPDANASTNTNWSSITNDGDQDLAHNLLQVLFPTPTGQLGGGNPAVAIGCWDASTAGNFLFSALLNGGGQIYDTDEAPLFLAGDIILAVS